MSAVVKVLCDKLSVQMPICTEVYNVLYKGKSGREAAMSLLSREQKSEQILLSTYIKQNSVTNHEDQ